MNKKSIKKFPELVATTIESFDSQDTRPVKIFFEDEAIFGRINELMKCWAPHGIRPLVSKQTVREYLYVYAAACPADGESFSLIMPECNANNMSIFLKEFSKYYSGYRAIMVMDKAGWHKAKDIGLFDNIRIIYQPAYSPELNPVEHIWDHIREKYFPNRIYESLDNVEEELIIALKNLDSDKHTLQSMIGFPWTMFDI